jgi:hypothetical protein
MRKIIPILVLVFSVSILCVAQDVTIASIKWNSVQTFNTVLGMSLEEATDLITYGKAKIEWKNLDGSIRKSFQVVELVGDWIDIREVGQIVYEVKEGENSGTITLRKTPDEIIISITIVGDDVSLTQLKIQNIQVL